MTAKIKAESGNEANPVGAWEFVLTLFGLRRPRHKSKNKGIGVNPCFKHK